MTPAKEPPLFIGCDLAAKADRSKETWLQQMGDAESVRRQFFKITL